MAKLRLPTAHTVISEIKEMIAKDGVQVFETNGRIQLYSGPQRWIAAILKTLDNNHGRAFAQSWDASAAEATMIDVTPAGRRLEKYDGDRNIYDYFQSIYVDDPVKAYYHAILAPGFETVA